MIVEPEYIPFLLSLNYDFIPSLLTMGIRHFNFVMLQSQVKYDVAQTKDLDNKIARRQFRIF